MITSLKKLIKFSIYYIINQLIKPSQEIMPKTLLLIRLDAIGDYVLFRNFIETLRKSNKFKNYKITLLGNIAWKDLATELDSKLIDRFIWLDTNQFNKNFIYRYQKLKDLAFLGYQIVLNPVYSRDFFIGDNIVKLITADEKIGSIGDLSNIKRWQKNISDNYYTKLIPAENKLIFEFNRNREFFETILEEKLDTVKPFISLKPKKLAFELPQNYAILFIGASARFRKWNIQSFAKVGKYIKDSYGHEIVLCGAPSDREGAAEFAKYFKDHYLDLVGKTSLVDLLYVISNGDLIIANETSAPHFAVSLEMTNIFVISNGNHYGRFTPYPKEITQNYHVIYHPEIENTKDDFLKSCNSYGFGSDLDISDISPESVNSKIKKVLKIG